MQDRLTGALNRDSLNACLKPATAEDGHTMQAKEYTEDSQKKEKDIDKSQINIGSRAEQV